MMTGSIANKTAVHRLLPLLLAFLVALPTWAAGNWTWELSNARYKQLNAFQRAQYDKASQLFKQGNYQAAAAEFEKFKIQFQDSDIIPYVVFMIGYSQQQSKHRLAAIRTYNEVLDYFGDLVEDAAPALYFMGIAHLDNGDVREGMVLLKEMADDPDYQKHPLAAGALRRVADNAWKNQDFDVAVRYYKQVVRDFGDSNRSEADIARNNVTSYYVKNQDYASYEAWLLDDENREVVTHRVWMAEHAWQIAYRGFGGDWEKYTNFNREDKQKDMLAFYTWFQQQKPWYEKAENAWGYYHNLLLFASHRLGDRLETRKLLEETVVPMSKKLADEKQRNDRFAWLSDRLREGGDFDQALYCISFMNDAPYAGYKEYEVLAHKGSWQAAVERLVQVEALGNADWATRALGQRAWVYRDRLNDYKTAIELYQQLNNPPQNLWAIQECYKRWGKLKEALQVLSEIEGSFPNDAPNAAWYKASYYHEAGDQAQAIATARRILAVYKESQAASNAHQLLEKYGVDAGGGVVQ